ncbi:MAG: ATP-binding cassette domain-containing protein [Desulfurococcaceae archaeon]
MDLLVVRDLKKYFTVKHGLFSKSTYLKAVDGVDFQVPEGSTIGIVGESGSGKSTLGLTILRLVEPTSGEIIFDGTDITKLSGKELKWFRRSTGIVFQDPYSSLNPRMRIKDILSRPLIIHKICNDKAEMMDMMIKVLEDVGLGQEHLDRYPHELSGGQQQRVSIARAIILRPKLVVLDEPTSSLDVSIQAQILNLLLDLQAKYKLTYVFITHDLLTAKHISDKLLVMYAGKAVEYGNASRILKNPRHPYTVFLLSSVPYPDPKIARSRGKLVIQGEPPSPLNPPTGCRFHPRCPFAIEKCKTEEPRLEKIDIEHQVACHRVFELSFDIHL